MRRHDSSESQSGAKICSEMGFNLIVLSTRSGGSRIGPGRQVHVILQKNNKIFMNGVDGCMHIQYTIILYIYGHKIWNFRLEGLLGNIF